METENEKAVKQLIRWLEIARNGDQITFHVLIISDEFLGIIKTAKRACQAAGLDYQDVKDLIELIESARHADQVAYRTKMDSDELGQKIETAKKACRWNQADDRVVENIAEKLHGSMCGGTLMRKSARLREFLRVANTAAALNPFIDWLSSCLEPPKKKNY